MMQAAMYKQNSATMLAPAGKGCFAMASIIIMLIIAIIGDNFLLWAM